MASSDLTTPTLAGDAEQFESPKQASAKSTGDDVYPLHVLDDMKLNHAIVTWPMIFNDVLDAEKLRSALENLLGLPGWRKLGGRIVAKADGKKHELHVPAYYTAENPAFTYSHLEFSDVRLQDHPTAKHLPKPSSNAYAQQVFAHECSFQEFMVCPDHPKNVTGLRKARLPQLSLHITSFSDATIVSLTWPHTLMDGIGQADLLSAWSLSLAGKLNEVPEILGIHEDVLKKLEDPNLPTEPLVVAPRKMGVLGLARFFAILVLRYLRLRIKGTERYTKMIFLPKAAVEKLKKRANEHVPSDDYVTTGDVLASWMLHNLMASQPKPTPLYTMFLVNSRYRLPWLSSPEGIYLQNLVGSIAICLDRTGGREPLGRVTQEIRSQIKAQATEAQLTTLIKNVRQEVMKMGRPALKFYGESDAAPVFFNNLSKSEFLARADFGPAVVRQGEDSSTRNNPVGKAVLYLHRPLGNITGLIDSFYVLSKDHAGNYWLMGTAVQGTWDRFDEEIQGLVES